MSKEAMKLALEALEKVSTRTVIMGSTGDYREGQLDALSAVSNDVATAITALREALAEQPAQQEPVAYVNQHGVLYSPDDIVCLSKANILTALYAHPQAREPLKWEAIRMIVREANRHAWSKYGRMATDEEIARAIEAAHGIKENT